MIGLFLRVICYCRLQLIQWLLMLDAVFIKLRMVPGLQSFINSVDKTENTLENTVSPILQTCRSLLRQSDWPVGDTEKLWQKQELSDFRNMRKFSLLPKA